MNKGRSALWLLSICLAGVTLVHLPNAFSAEEASSIEEASSMEEAGAQEVEDKSSETPATVQEPVAVEETPEGTTQTPEEQQPGELEEQQPGKEVTESPDVFNPTEEISEDFAVAFPVDI